MEAKKIVEGVGAGILVLMVFGYFYYLSLMGDSHNLLPAYFWMQVGTMGTINIGVALYFLREFLKK